MYNQVNSYTHVGCVHRIPVQPSDARAARGLRFPHPSAVRSAGTAVRVAPRASRRASAADVFLAILLNVPSLPVSCLLVLIRLVRGAGACRLVHRAGHACGRRSAVLFLPGSQDKIEGSEDH